MYKKDQPLLSDKETKSSGDSSKPSVSTSRATLLPAPQTAPQQPQYGNGKWINPDEDNSDRTDDSCGCVIL